MWCAPGPYVNGSQDMGKRSFGWYLPEDGQRRVMCTKPLLCCTGAYVTGYFTNRYSIHVY